MLDEEEYSSDTSDDDYVPIGAADGNSSSNPSEVEEEVSDESDGEETVGKKGKQQKKKRKQKKPAQADENDSAGKADTLSSPKLDDKRIESLWASFKETAPAPATKSDTAAKSSESSALSVPSKAPAPVPSETKPVADPKPSPLATTSAVKRPAIKSGGLADLASRLGAGKKLKLTTLEKSKKDWDTFKKAEGIEEDLKTFNQGKMGFLERKAFLERADVKQFEIEKGLRLGRKPQ